MSVCGAEGRVGWPHLCIIRKETRKPGDPTEQNTSFEMLHFGARRAQGLQRDEGEADRLFLHAASAAQPRSASASSDTGRELGPAPQIMTWNIEERRACVCDRGA